MTCSARWTGRRSSAGRAAAGRRPTSRSVARSSCATAGRPTGPSCGAPAGRASRSSSTGSVAVVDVERLGRGRSRLIDRRAHATPSCRRSRAATTSSRSTASPTASPATTPASCGRRPRRWSSASTSRPDDVVEAGARLGVVEAMKMEIAIPAPVAGRVRDVFVTRNVQVDAGAPLFRIEPVGDDAADAPAGAARRADGAGQRRRARSVGRHGRATADRRGVHARLRRRRRRRPAGSSPRRAATARRRHPACAGDPRRLRRPRRRGSRAAGRRRRRRRSAGTARAASTPTCARSTSSARACRSGSASGCCGRSPTTA